MQPGLIQTLIHQIEIGAGSRYLRLFALAVAVIALGVLYDVRAARDFSAPEAMDAAQLARNIATGKGYTTKLIRPFSLFLVQRHNGSATAMADTNLISSRIQTLHPDLENPPVYPVVLAGLMKILPFKFTVETKKPFWSDGGNFQRYQPEFLITVFNEILLLGAVLLAFLLARKLFDSGIAWFSAVLVVGCEEFWRFSAAGLSTILLLNIFLALTICVLRIERGVRDSQPAPRLLAFSIFAGALAGVGALTRYSFGWTIVPVVIFLILFGGRKKNLHALAAFATFTVFLTPWIVRNEIVSGTAFGTAGYAFAENTFMFPEFQLQRSIHPNLTHVFWLEPYVQKFLANLRDIFSNDLPRLGGSWASILFLAGLLLNFRSTRTRRVRYFLLMCAGTFIFAQALGKTELSVESPEINSENLLIILAPVDFIYGASFFFTLLDHMRLPLLQLRYTAIGIFATLCCLPMFFSLLPPKPSPVNYPPYFPPEIQTVSGWMQENELMMSDVPWAVAWYGDRQCVWLTRNWRDDFNAVGANFKPVQALYLTPKTTDGKFLSDFMEDDERGWGNFIFQTLTEKQIPSGFPLTKMPTGYFPEKIFLSDKQRW